MRAIRVAAFIVAGALLLAAPGAAQRFESVPEGKAAEQGPLPAGVKVGVISIQAAMANTQEGKKAAEELRARFSPRQAELDKIQRELRDLDNQLRTQERTLSEEARAQIARQIELKRKEGQRLDQDLRDDYEYANDELLNRIGSKMQQIIGRYAQEKNLNIVFNAVPWFQGGPFVYADSTVDITEDIVRLYDQTYPVQAAAPAQPPAQKPAAAPPRSNPPPK